VSGGKTSPDKLRLAERRQKAFALRKAGATFRAIASQIASEMDQPKYNDSLASKDVQFILNELTQLSIADAAEFRQMELERLDAAQIAIALPVQAGDLYAIDRWIKIIETRCKILGLYLPQAERPAREETTGEIELQLITQGRG